MAEGFWDNAEVITQYTRAESIADGVLVELPQAICLEAGFKVPVAVTSTLWSELIALHPTAESALCDESGRLWDVLWMLRVAIRTAGGQSSRVDFAMYAVVPPDSRYKRSRGDRKASLVHCVSVCGPNDDGSPCITIMMHDED